MTEIDELAERYWDRVLENDPLWATLVGDHRDDRRLGHVADDDEAALRTDLLVLRAEVVDIDVGDERAEVVRDSLVGAVDRGLAAVGGHDGDAVPHAVVRHDQMRGWQAWVLSYLPMTTYPEPTHAWDVPDRYRDVPRFLDDAFGRLLEGLERGVSPVARNLDRVGALLEAYLAGPLDDDPLVGVRGPEDWDGEAAWRDELRGVVADVVRPALARYRDRLEAELAPYARDDDHAGLCHVEGGADLYASFAATETTLDVDPDEVHRIGVDHITGPLAAEWSELGSATFGESDPARLMDLLRTDESLRYATPDEVEQHARQAVSRATAAAGDWFGRLPAAPCVVTPVPEYLSASSGPAYYLPPASDGSRPGTYHINSLDVDCMLRSEGEATAFHEAIPGHHLQLAIASELVGVPTFMQRSVISAYAEGWGLYAERLADEMGLYSSDVDRLGMLSLDAFRAARLVVDTGLHVQGWSRQRAIEWMHVHTPLPAGTIASEVDRYIAMPGQALGYKLGQMEIRRLREEAAAALGDDFDVAAFHDVVLGRGNVSLPVLDGMVTRWVAAA